MHKIMFVISSMGAGGAERVMSLLINRAIEQGNDVLLALISSDTVEYELEEKVDLRYISRTLPKGRVQASYGRFSRLRNIIRHEKPQRIISFTTTCNIYTCLAAVGLGIPVIISERNDPVRDCPNKLRRFVRNVVYRLADGFVFQTEDARDYFKGKIRRKGVVIPNPVKDNLPLADTENRGKSVVAAARLTKQKNYPMMLEAFAKFREVHLGYKLQIFGDGEDKEMLQEYAASLKIADCVEFMGVAKDLHQRIKRAGMFVLSSDYEGISNSLLEALSMGLPCVSTDCPCGGSRHLIEDGVNGLLTPVGDVEGFARAMGSIADDDTFAKTLGQNALQIRHTHAAAVILEQYFDYIMRTGHAKNT